MTEFTHRALVELVGDGDPRALGGAITTALCGHWEHDGACRWPHRTEIAPAGNDHLVTTIFTVDPANEAVVRERIRAAIRSGELAGPDGRLSRWAVRGAPPP